MNGFLIFRNSLFPSSTPPQPTQYVTITTRRGSADATDSSATECEKIHLKKLVGQLKSNLYSVSVLSEPELELLSNMDPNSVADITGKDYIEQLKETSGRLAREALPLLIQETSLEPSPCSRLLLHSRMSVVEWLCVNWCHSFFLLLVVIVHRILFERRQANDAIELLRVLTNHRDLTLEIHRNDHLLVHHSHSHGAGAEDDKLGGSSAQ